MIAAVLALTLSLQPAQAQSLAEIVAQQQLPALSTAVRKNGQTTLDTAGMRVLGGKVPATSADRWHIGSNSKALTAALGAILVERGLLRWDSTLAELFPDWPLHPAYKQITMRELFAHRAGIHHDISTFAGGAFWKEFQEPGRDLSELREKFARAVLTTAPETDGSKFHYSNSGYMVAGHIFTKLTGKSWEELMSSLVFRPLGMDSCGYGAPGAESPAVPSQPWPHETVLDIVRPISPANPDSDNPLALGPAGTIHCSLRDWLKFAQAQIDGFHGRDTAILKAAGFAPLQTDYQGQGYTSGGLIYENRAGKVRLGHNGSNTLNFAILVMDMDTESAYAAATNIGFKRGEKGAQAAMQAIGSPDICNGSFCLLTK